MDNRPEYQFLPELNWWVRWEQDPEDPHSFHDVRLPPAVVAELQLDSPTSMATVGGADGVDDCTNEELVSFAPISISSLATSPADSQPALPSKRRSYLVLC